LRPDRRFAAITMTIVHSLPPLVYLEKIAAREGAIFPPGEAAAYPYGLANNAASLPVHYAMVGWMIGTPRIGQCLLLLRISRNNVHCMGVFRSSPVMAVQQDFFWTQNSVYRWRDIRANEADALRTLDRN